MKWIALALLGSLIVGSLVSVETTEAWLSGLESDVVRNFDWLFIAVATATLALAAALGLHPTARLKLGRDDEEPEFSRFSWFAMLFSAGLASGLLYWAAAEPILHHQANPFLDRAGIAGGSAAAVDTALHLTIFHWGLHGWGMYVVGGLAIGIYSYRHGLPLTIRSALYPLLGREWLDRWPGRLVDLFALLGTVFGVATSIGLSAAGLNATLYALFGLAVEVPTQVWIVFIACALGIASAVSGVGRGIRVLSEINIHVSSAFLICVLALGPTLEIFRLIGASVVDYLSTFPRTGVWISSTPSEQQWQAEWTVFYWGWWLAWMPFVSLFIARISRGRTIREFVIAVLGVPTAVVMLWMGILGGTALEQELTNPGSVSVAVGQDYSLGIVSILENLPLPAATLALTWTAAFLMFSWLITSLDSATLALCHLVDEPEATRHKVLWGSVLAGVTAVLLLAGGIGALQAASVVIGLPLALVMLAIGVGLLKDLVAGKL